MYETCVYAITPRLWRWEVRCGGTLLRCGMSPTQTAAEAAVKEITSVCE